MYCRYIQDGSFWQVESYMVREQVLQLPSKYMNELCPATTVTSIPESKVFRLGIEHPINNELEVCRVIFLSYFMPQLKVLDNLSLHDLCSVYAFVDAYFLPVEEDLVIYSQKIKKYILDLIKKVEFPELLTFRYLNGEISFKGDFPFMDGVIEKIRMKGCISTKFEPGANRLNLRDRCDSIGKIVLRLIHIFRVFKDTFPQSMVEIMKLAEIDEDFIELL